MNEEYVWSSDEETFRSARFDTRALALTDAKDYFDGEDQTVWTGKVGTYEFDVDVSRILDDLAEQSYNEVGEVSEDWPNLSEAQEKELSTTLNGLVQKFFVDHSLTPDFYKVIEVEKHKLTA